MASNWRLQGCRWLWDFLLWVFQFSSDRNRVLLLWDCKCLHHSLWLRKCSLDKAHKRPTPLLREQARWWQRQGEKAVLQSCYATWQLPHACQQLTYWIWCGYWEAQTRWFVIPCAGERTWHFSLDPPYSLWWLCVQAQLFLLEEPQPCRSSSHHWYQDCRSPHNMLYLAQLSIRG